MLTLPNGNLVPSYSSFNGGISDYPKNAQDNEYAFGRSIDYRTDPNALTLLPKTTKESGSVVLGLPKDGDLVGTNVYYYDDLGNIYKRTSAGSHSLLRSVASSHGNGMKYYAEDDFLYYTSDKVIGRYGQISGTPTFVDDFLGSEGGVPLNTYSLDLESGSSQYASRADTASLSITSDLAIECSIKPESLPTAGNSMVLWSKWDINANKRSYKFEIYAVSGYFGDGSDGALTISADTTEAPIDSVCTGTSGLYALSATNASFAAGQIILIHQTQGTGAGTQQKNKISSYTAGTITLDSALNATYGTGAQVRVLKQYTNVTINSGKIYTAKAWNGTVGGILAFLANGTVTGTGTITASGKGFRGGAAVSGVSQSGTQGEGTSGTGSQSYVANTSGGGGGQGGTGADRGGGGGGGGHALTGTIGGSSGATTGGAGGASCGTADLTTLVFGGAGGAGATNDAGGGPSGIGGESGGIIFIAGATITITGAITTNGVAGQDSPGNNLGGGGGGTGGAVLLKAQTATLGAGLITATAGLGGSAGGAGVAGGNGSTGRIHLDYYTSYTGTTSPTLDVIQDNTLVTNTTYQLRLGLSSNGTLEEFLTKNCTVTTGSHFHVGVSWDASDHEAEFFQEGASLGSSSGAATSLNDNASVAGLGADFNSTARNFYDGIIDEVRIWNTERTAAQMLANKGVQIAVNSPGLVAYYKLNNDYTDSTSNANDLTSSGSPVFSTDVPFSSPTARLDLDQELNTSGNTYTTPIAISEATTARQTFVPTKEPQKSVEVLVAGKGTGTWTVTVHDSLNRVVATASKTTGEMATGDSEFIFTTAWRPILGASYHFHVTSTVADGTVTTTSANDLETVDFHTYYQFLVTDTDYHPVEQFLNFLLIGNERYVAKYSASGTYEPHKLTFPSGWRVRCFGFWKGYIAIGLWKGTNIYDTDQGAIALWDGKSSTYNEFIYIPEGAINALLGTRGVLYVWAGYHGDMLEYRGGDYAQIRKRVPKMTKDKYIEIMPKAVSMWDALLRWGISGVSDSSVVERGVYTWGRRKESDPESLSFDYPISTGNRAATNIKIGFIFPVAKKLLIGWKDNVSYGMDVVDPAGTPFTTGTIEKDIKDLGAVWKEKQALTLRADFKELNTGETVRLKYRLDRASDWTYGDTATSGDVARLPIPYGNHKELEVAADLGTSVSTSPTLLGLTLEINPKKSESIV